MIFLVTALIFLILDILSSDDSVQLCMASGGPAPHFFSFVHFIVFVSVCNKANMRLLLVSLKRVRASGLFFDPSGADSFVAVSGSPQCGSLSSLWTSAQASVESPEFKSRRAELNG